jgi:hypothetical protein
MVGVICQCALSRPDAHAVRSGSQERSSQHDRASVVVFQSSDYLGRTESVDTGVRGIGGYLHRTAMSIGYLGP